MFFSHLYKNIVHKILVLFLVHVVRKCQWNTRAAFTIAMHSHLTLILLMWRIGWAPNSIPIYIQQDATLHSLFISGKCSTCFGWYFHPSSGAHTTVSTASGICCILLDIHVYWNIPTVHGPINVKSLNNTSKWQMGINSAFKGLNRYLPHNSH
jgi:hypothetical protein